MPAMEETSPHAHVDPTLPSLMDDPHFARIVFASVTSGICIADATQPDMPVVYVNPAFEAITGYPMQEMLGRNCRMLQSPPSGQTIHASHSSQSDQTNEATRSSIRHAIREQREVLTVLRNFRKDGTPFWNELYLSPIRNADGKVTHFVGIQSDVTARIDVEAALRESEKLAAVGRLASSTAHEINNPLESVMNLIYLAERSETLAEARRYLLTADGELERVKLLTTQSLRFFKQSTKPQAVNASELLDAVLNLYQSRIHNAGVLVHRRERSTDSIVCMESEIRQVLNNLIGNAIDAMHGSSGTGQKAARLLIRTRTGRDWISNRHGIVITIADTGHGIDPITLKNIYKAFYTTKGIGGTGLGLWISSEIVTRHQGRLLVRSSQHRHLSGTIFQLFLPLQGLAASN